MAQPVAAEDVEYMFDTASHGAYAIGRRAELSESASDCCKNKKPSGFVFLMSFSKILSELVGADTLYEGSEDISSLVFDVVSSIRLKGGKLIFKSPKAKRDMMEIDDEPARKRAKVEQRQALEIELSADTRLEGGLARVFKARTLVPAPTAQATTVTLWNARLAQAGEAYNMIAWRQKKKTIGIVAIPIEQVLNLFHTLYAADTILAPRENEVTKNMNAAEKKWSAVVQGLGRFSDQANRFEGLMFTTQKSIYGKLSAPVAWGWMFWTGAKLSRYQNVKYAVSHGVGNLLKAIAMQRGQMKAKGSSAESTRKIKQLIKELQRRCIHPAQRYIVGKLDRPDLITETEAVTKLATSWLVKKPRMETAYLVPLAFWDNTGKKGWQGHLDMYVKNIDKVWTNYEQFPLMSMLALPFEDAGIIGQILGQPLRPRKDYSNTTVKDVRTRGNVTHALKPQWVFPPLKGSPSGGSNTDQIVVGGVSQRIERENKDSFDAKALMTNESYSSLDAASRALTELIGQGKQDIEVRGANEGFRLQDGGRFDWTTPEPTRVQTTGKTYFAY